MNDKEWNRLRWRMRIDQWVTWGAWLACALGVMLAATFAYNREWPWMVVALAIAAWAVHTARIEIPLITIDDDPEDSDT